MDNDSNAKDMKDFLRIASLSTALGFGCVGVVISSMRPQEGGLDFVGSWWTPISFVVGAFIGYYGWKVAAMGKMPMRACLAVFVLIGLAGFLSPLRFVPKDRLMEISIGLVVAAVVVSAGGILIWRVAHSLNSEAERTDANKKH